MAEIKVHPRVHRRHPEIDDEDVRSAWRNAIRFVLRQLNEKDHYLVIGQGTSGRVIEIVAAREDDGSVLVFHAMTPPSKKTLSELGFIRR